MAGTTIIGKVGVKVFPDTSDFSKDLKRQLETIEKKHKLEIPVHLDSKTVAAEAKRIEGSTRVKPIKIKIDVDKKPLGDIEQSVRNLDKLAVPKVFEQLTKRQIFDPSSKAQFKAQIDGINQIVKSEEKLANQRAKAVAENDRATKDSIKAAADAGKRRLSIEDSITKANKDAADSVKKLAAESDKLVRELGKIQFDKDFARQVDMTNSLLAEMDDELAKIANYNNISIDLELRGMSEVDRKVDALRTKIDSLSATLTPEMSEEDRRKVLHQIADLRDQIDNELDDVEIKVVPTIANAARKAAQVSLAVLSRARTVNLIPKVNPAAAKAAGAALAALSGARLTGNVMSDVYDFVTQLDKNLPKISALSSVSAGIAGWALSASSNLFALSSSLAQIGPAALALPGIFGGIAIGVTTTVIAFGDMNRQFPGLKKGWEGLKSTIRANFWDEAKKPMLDLARAVMPEVTRGFERAGTELGNFFGHFSTSLKDAFTNNNALRGMFTDLGLSIAIAAQHTDGFAGIITTLGSKGAGLLPRLATYFTTITDRFDAFLSKADKDGRLDKWIENGIFQMRELGRSIYGLGGILGGLGKAAKAGGGSTLTMFADSLENISKIVNGKTFQTALIGTFRAANAAMDRISTISGPAISKMFLSLAGLLQRVLPIVGETLGIAFQAIATALSNPHFQDGIVALFGGILTAVKALAPVLPILARAFGSLFEVLGVALADVAPILATVLTTMANAFIILAPSISTVAGFLSTAFLGVVKTLVPVILTLVKALAPLIVQLGTELAFTLVSLAPSLVHLVRAFFELAVALAPAFVTLVKGLADAFILLAPHLPLIAEKLGGAILDAITYLVPILPSLVTSFLMLVDAFVEMLPQLLELVPLFVQLLPPIIELAKDILPILLWALRDIVPYLGEMAAGLRRVIEQWNSSDWDFGLVEAWAKLKKAAGGVIDALVDAFGPNGRRRVVEGIKQTGRELVQGFKDLLGIHSPSRVFIELGGQIIAGLIQGLGGAAASRIGVALSGVGRTITGLFSNAGTWLLNAGSNVITGFINGITRSFRAVRDTLATLTSYLPSWKGPPSTDKTLLEDAGSLVIQGFINGLESQYDAVKDSLKGLTKDVAKTQFDIAAPSLENGSGVSVAATVGSELASPTVSSATNGAGESPLIGGDLVLQSSGDPQADLQEAMFQLRRLRRGGSSGRN